MFGDAGQRRGKFVGGGADAHLYDDPDAAAIPALLDSRFDGEQVDAQAPPRPHLAGILRRPPLPAGGQERAGIVA